MAVRLVYMVLSSKALPYASRAIETLFENCTESVNLTLITDEKSDRLKIEEAIGTMVLPQGSECKVVDKNECDDKAEDHFRNQPKLREFRYSGHPCWRKVTDPLLYGSEEDEFIVLDPDLYFPNKFSFEPTPEKGVLLMYQRPNCLFPPEAVTRAMDKGVPLANHVDIGIGQAQNGSIDVDWLNWFISAIDAMDFRAYMHIEAIVWAACAMRFGGGYFEPSIWRCWQRGHIKRMLFASGLVSGPSLLKWENLEGVKCIHVSGPSKWWVLEAEQRGILKTLQNSHTHPSKNIDFIELSRDEYINELKMKDIFRKIGYYRITKSS